MGKSVDRTPDSVISLKSNDHTPHGASKASNSLPLSILYTEKFHLLDNGVWRKREPDRSRALFGEAPAAVELLNAEAASRFNVAGGLTDNLTLQEGQPIPKEIIAVVRPKSIVVKKKGHTNGRTDQQSIVPDEMEMNLEVKVYDFAPPEADMLKAGKEAKGVVYSGKTKAIMKQDVQGLYCFNTSGNQLEHLFTQMGTYMFHFSLLSSKYGEVPPAVVRVNVAPANANMCDANCLEQARHRKRRGRKHTGSGSVGGGSVGGGSVDIAPAVAEEEAEDDDFPEPRLDVTHIHVTTLDEVVSLNVGEWILRYCCVPGIGIQPPSSAESGSYDFGATQIGVLCRSERVPRCCFVGENGRDKENSKFAEINQTFLRSGILASAIGSILGAIFLIVSMVVLIEIRLGALTCGNPWAVKTTVPFVILGVSGCAIFIVAVFYESVAF